MLVSNKVLANLKLNGIKAEDLKQLADNFGVDSKGRVSDIILRLVDMPQGAVDVFIKQKYQAKIEERQKLIPDEELVQELHKVTDFKWNVVQGALDRKIQNEYVRKFFRYEDIINGVKSQLHDEVTQYVLASWYNHWTTVLIEDHISQHSRIVPTLKNNFGVDIFFDNQPFDLKITYLPKDIKLEDALRDPQKVMVWLYENQGEQRFGDDNRLFVVLADKNNLEDSWKLKRDFDYIFNEIDQFFNSASVSEKDEIIFTYKKKTYTTVSKILFITK